MNLGDCVKISKSIAIIDLSDGERKLTFEQFDSLCDGVARSLASYNIGDHIAVISENNIELLCYLYGIMRAGMVPVLINPNLPNAQIDYILNDSSSKLVLRKQDFNAFLNPGSFDTVDMKETDDALCLYTSGTTGNPKGVVHNHGSRYWILNKHASSLVNDRSAILTAIQYASALSNIQLSFFSGNSVVLFPKFNPKIVLPAIEKYNITTVSAVTPLMNMMLNEQRLLERTNLNSVRNIRLGASITKEATVKKCKQYFSNATVSLFYGITEIGPSLFGKHPTIKTPEMSVGYPIDGIEYKIVNGSLHLKTPNMFSGYKNKSDYLTDDGFYDTRDMFEIDENGFYYCLGRLDDSFKSGGNMIVPQEIETVIEQNRAVNSSVVVPVEDDVKIFKPVCFYVGNASEESIVDFLSDKLERYKIPRKFWKVESLPINSSGKIDRKQLTQMAEELWNKG